MAADLRKIYVYDDFSSFEPILAGCLYITPIRGGERCAFEYDEAWLKKMSPAVSLDPELMPFPGRQYPAGKTLFGVFADASPDRWGRVLMNKRERLRAEKESGKILMLGHNQRLIKAHMKAKELLEQGAIGDLLFFQCNFKHAGPESWSADPGAATWFFRKDQTNFGVMGDLGAHKIDLIRYLTGCEIKNVFAKMMTLDKRYADGSLIDLEDNSSD